MAAISAIGGPDAATASALPLAPMLDAAHPRGDLEQLLHRVVTLANKHQHGHRHRVGADGRNGQYLVDKGEAAERGA